MKIIVLLENNVQSGGAFNQGINAILQIRAICRDNFELQVFSIKKKISNIWLTLELFVSGCL